MKLLILFGQRVQQYEGQYAPEALLCWDEYCVDENPDGWADAVEAEKKKALDSKDFTAVRVIEVVVDGNKVYRLLNETPILKGEVQE